jgi:hypothetical protein
MPSDLYDRASLLRRKATSYNLNSLLSGIFEPRRISLICDAGSMENPFFIGWFYDERNGNTTRHFISVSIFDEPFTCASSCGVCVNNRRQYSSLSTSVSLFVRTSMCVQQWSLKPGNDLPLPPSQFFILTLPEGSICSTSTSLPLMVKLPELTSPKTSEDLLVHSIFTISDSIS